MTRRRRSLVLAIGAVLLVALAATVGCSSDDSASGTTAVAASSETTAADDDGVTTTSLSDEAFSAETGELAEQVGAAGDDLCAVAVAIIDGPAAQPATPQQVEAAVEVQVAVFRQLAATTPIDEPNAEIVEATADRIEAAAAAAEYPVDLFGRDDFVEIVQSEEFIGAVQTYFERAGQQCPEVAEQLGGGAGAPTG